jgi:hypothetical protein
MMYRRSLTALAAAAAILLWTGATAGEKVTAPLPSQVSKTNGVTVTATPRNLLASAKTWDFEVTLETHTRPLDEDLAKSSRLIDDGIGYSPMGWEGTPPGGHHRKGLLQFKPISPQPQAVELQIRLRGEPAPRSFRWRLK